MALQDLSDLRSLPEYLDHQRDVRTQITALETEYKGQPFPEDVRPEYAELRKRDTDLEPIINELQAREKYLTTIAENGGGSRGISDDVFNTREARGTSRERDLYDLTTIRGGVTGAGVQSMELRDRAMAILEETRFAFGKPDDVRDHVAGLIEMDADGALEGPPGALAARMLTTGGPTYRRAFAKLMAGREAALTTGERQAVEQAKAAERALSTTQSGYAVPFQVDPTVIPISNGVTNPLRAISRIVQVTSNEWRGITSEGITASYSAQATETSDNTPTLANPTFTVAKAQAFVPFNIEAEDWSGLQAAMGADFADAKDTLEATKFLTGGGTNEPSGLLTGGTAVVTSATSAVFAAADLFSLIEALPDRFQPNARIIASLFIYDKVRQFGTATGYAYLTDLPGPLPGTLLGYPRHTLSTMATSTGTAQKVMTIGDFRQFAIVDRIGLNVEFIPHLFGTASNYPTGQRGLYMYWRNTSGVTTWRAFRTLQIKAT